MPHHYSGATTAAAAFPCKRLQLNAQTRAAFLSAFLAKPIHTDIGASKRSRAAAGTGSPVKRQRLVLSSATDVSACRHAALPPSSTSAVPTLKSGHVDATRLQRLLQSFRLQAQRDGRSGFVAMQTLNSDALGYDARVDASTFEAMATNVAEQYAQVDQVLCDAGLTDTTTELSAAHVVEDGPHGPFVRFATAKVAPFAMDTVSRAMWKTAEKKAVHIVKAQEEGAEALTEGGDARVLYLKTIYTLQDDAVAASGISVLLRGVCRRYVEADRVVLVWEGRGDWPEHYIRDHPSSVPIRERGYCVIRTVQSERVKGRRDAAPLSLSQTCVCMTPGLSADIGLDSPECLQVLSDSVIPSYRKILEAREQTLENALLDEMIQSRVRGPTKR